MPWSQNNCQRNQLMNHLLTQSTQCRALNSTNLYPIFNSSSGLHEKFCIVLEVSGSLRIFVNHSSFILQLFFHMALLPTRLVWDTEAAWATVLLITADSWLPSCDWVLKTCHENIWLKQLFLPYRLLVWWIFESV